MAVLLCSEADVRQRVAGKVLGTFLASDLQNGDAYLVGEEESADGMGLIPRWSADFEYQVGYAIALRTGSVDVSGRGTNQIVLPRAYTPIREVHSITWVDGGGDVTSFSFDSESGVVYLREEPYLTYAGYGGSYGRQRLELPRFSAGRGNLTVTLRYGYESIPPEVRGAVADRCAADVLLEDRGRRDKGVTSKELGDRSESYGKGRWSDEIDRMVAAYNDVVSHYESQVAAAMV